MAAIGITFEKGLTHQDKKDILSGLQGTKPFVLSAQFDEATGPFQKNGQPNYTKGIVELRHAGNLENLTKQIASVDGIATAYRLDLAHN